MSRLREGIDIPIIPEDFIVSRKKVRPDGQSTAFICVKKKSPKIDLKAGRTCASRKKRNVSGDDR
jgi:hypothetical protein